MSDITKRDAEILLKLVDEEIHRICNPEVREEAPTAFEQRSIAECEAIYALDSTGSQP